MTCRDFGGPCDHKMTAETSEEMLKMGQEHLENTLDEPHVKALMEMKEMSPKERKKWNYEFTKKWESIPDSDSAQAM